MGFIRITDEGGLFIQLNVIWNQFRDGSENYQDIINFFFCSIEFILLTAIISGSVFVISIIILYLDRKRDKDE